MFFLLILGLANYILQEILFIQIVKCIFVTFFLISSNFFLNVCCICCDFPFFIPGIYNLYLLSHSSISRGWNTINFAS